MKKYILAVLEKYKKRTSNIGFFTDVNECKAKVIDNAIDRYAKDCKRSEILAVSDTTLFASGKEGYVVTSDYIYSSFYDNGEICTYKKFEPVSVKNLKSVSKSGDKYLKFEYDDGSETMFYCFVTGDRVYKFLCAVLEEKAEAEKEEKKQKQSEITVTPEEMALSEEERLKLGHDAYYSGKYGNARALLTDLAEKGYDEAQYLIGVMYVNGFGVKQDRPYGIQWIQKAVNCGYKQAVNFKMKGLRPEERVNEGDKETLDKLYAASAKAYEDGDYDKALKLLFCLAGNDYLDAQVILSKFYVNGIGVEENEKEAWFWLNHAAERGNDEAMYELGRYYDSGTGVEQDSEKAKELYKKSAEKGNTDGCYMYGIILLTESNIPEEIEKGKELIKKAAAEGHEEAMEALENIKAMDGKKQILSEADEAYEREDFQKAYELFLSLAEDGNPYAQLRTAMLLLNGNGVPKDAETAVKWLQKASDANVGPAQMVLGEMYAKGFDVPKDLDIAVSLYKKAYENGIEEAVGNLLSLYIKKEDNENILYWGEILAKNGDAEVQQLLGQLYREAKNFDKSLYWLEKASNNGIADASFDIAILYASETRDTEKFAYWFRRSLDEGSERAKRFKRRVQ